MHQKQFKPNTALGESILPSDTFECGSLTENELDCKIVLIDFMIRHGVIAPDEEPNFMEILTRLHGRFDFASW